MLCRNSELLMRSGILRPAIISSHTLLKVVDIQGYTYKKFKLPMSIEL